ncbi:MAG: GxxExxY protein [Anaerolineales bacterium]|nr:GxxExxY protein [Anaerolineales bacterium]
MKNEEKNLLQRVITRAVIGCAVEVINELGSGFLESVYEKAMLLALHQKGISAVPQMPVTVWFRGVSVGEFYTDILVEKEVMVELRAVNEITPIHETQIINFLKATGIEVGLLINFGTPKLQYKRYTRRK